MEEFRDDTADHETLSLADLQMDDDATGSQEVNQTFYQDFFGEEWSTVNTCNKNSSPGRLVSDDNNVQKAAAKVEANPMFRSTSGSFRYMRLKIASTTGGWRSKSLSVMEKSRLTSKSNSRWQVFIPGLKLSKFPTKMDLDDIKSRQLRRQSTTTEMSGSPSVDHVSSEQTGGRRSWKKGWWKLIDVLGCGGGYVMRDTKVVV